MRTPGADRLVGSGLRWDLYYKTEWLKTKTLSPDPQPDQRGKKRESGALFMAMAMLKTDGLRVKPAPCLQRPNIESWPLPTLKDAKKRGSDHRFGDLNEMD